MSLFCIWNDYVNSDVLNKYLKIKILKDNINNISNNPDLWGNFVKPVKDKVFTGHIINRPKDLVGCCNQYENYEVLVIEPINVVYEWRGFVYYDDLIDLRPYRGNFEQ